MLSSHCVSIPLVGIDPVQPFISELQGRKARTDGCTTGSEEVELPAHFECDRVTDPPCEGIETGIAIRLPRGSRIAKPV